PSPANFRMLAINTAPYPQIRALHAAVWRRSVPLAMVDRIEGDWGSVFAEPSTTGTDTVKAYTIPEILRLAGWPQVDYLKCDSEGAELEIFSDPAAPKWLDDVACISVDTHDRFKPGCTEAVEKALPASRYQHYRSGEFHVFTRLGTQFGSTA